MLSVALFAAVALTQPLPTVVVDRDNVEIRKSCRLEIRGPIVDADNNGVIQITASAITIEGGDQVLRGALPETPPEKYSGYGVRISGRRVTLRNLKVTGFKGGIYASDAHGLELVGCDVSDNFRQKLKSTPEAEHLDDWLYPHDNDQNEWLTKWGAGIYIEASRKVVVRNCFARQGQNGLCLRDVHESRIYDNDFSYLSGWGVALYRSSDNVISHNALNFCIRGYSHGRYSRGQDSAGILLFEQCSRNLIGYNSATHGGDGFFGFAGKSALEGKDAGPGVGCNQNTIFGNDFSDAAANAIEITFSFDTAIVSNYLNRSHYGIWGGYSSRGIAVNNDMIENTIAAVAVEHGHDWQIRRNVFRGNRRGVQLWWDDDKDLLGKPWSKQNPTDARDHVIAQNRFENDQVGIELRGGATARGRDNEFNDVTTIHDVDEKSSWDEAEKLERVLPLVPQIPGTQHPKAREELKGRQHIIMTEYGPYPHDGSPFVRRVIQTDGTLHLEHFGRGAVRVKEQTPGLTITPHDKHLLVEAEAGEKLTPYRLLIQKGERTFSFDGILGSPRWNVCSFRSTVDPREDFETWIAAAGAGVKYQRANLDLPFRSYGPGRIPAVDPAVKQARLPNDHFGTLAESVVRIPAGTWQIETLSDDGVRVWVDDEVVIDNWTHHGPTRDVASLTLEAEREVRLKVAHFELDGYAVLQFKLKPVSP